MDKVERRKRIAELRSELSVLNKEEIIESIQNSLKSLFEDEETLAKINEFNLPVPTHITVEFDGQYDDEGGTNMRPSSFGLYDKDGKYISHLYEEAAWEEKSSYSERVYETNMYDMIRDWLSDTFCDGDEILDYVGDYRFQVGN